MQRPESIEDMLDRLMPVAISEKGQSSLDAMLDDLCGPEVEDQPAPRKSYWKHAIPPIGIAALVTLTFFKSGENPAANISMPVTEMGNVEELSLMRESDRIEALADEGLVANPQGGVMQAMRVRVVGENTFRDEETGIVMQISEPREEMLFYQVNAF